MQVQVFRDYFLGGKKKVCTAEIIHTDEDITTVEMPIGDIYAFSTKTGKVLNNTQLLSIENDNK